MGLHTTVSFILGFAVGGSVWFLVTPTSNSIIGSSPSISYEPSSRVTDAVNDEGFLRVQDAPAENASGVVNKFLQADEPAFIHDTSYKLGSQDGQCAVSPESRLALTADDVVNAMAAKDSKSPAKCAVLVQLYSGTVFDDDKVMFLRSMFVEGCGKDASCDCYLAYDRSNPDVLPEVHVPREFVPYIAQYTADAVDKVYGVAFKGPIWKAGQFEGGRRFSATESLHYIISYLAQTQMREYETYWAIEEDVRFLGNWGSQLFTPINALKGDLVMFERPCSAAQGRWNHGNSLFNWTLDWRYRMHGLVTLFQVSRAYLDGVHQMGLEGRGGYLEMFIPSACVYLGLKCIEVDSIGKGPYTHDSCMYTPRMPVFASFSPGSGDAAREYYKWKDGKEQCMEPMVLHPIKVRK